MTTIIPSYIKSPYMTGCLNLSVHKNNNDSVIILLPGQTLSAELFYGLSVYEDGTSITDKILKHGYDVVYLDPVGYGRSSGKLEGLYSREVMSEQIQIAVNILEKDYQNIILHGFCSTSHAPMIAASSLKNIRGIILQSPLRYDEGPQWSEEYFKKPKNFFIGNTIERLKEERLRKKSDSLLPKHNRLETWETIFLDKLQTFEQFKERGKWHSPNEPIWDLWLYPSMNGHQGWDIKNISCPVSVIKGEFDWECSTKYYDLMIDSIKPNLVYETIVPYGTHFTMWNNNYDVWADHFIKAIDKLFE